MFLFVLNLVIAINTCLATIPATVCASELPFLLFTVVSDTKMFHSDQQWIGGTGCDPGCSYSKWFDPRSYKISRWSMIVPMSVVLRRTVWDDIDWRFDNLSGSHHQSQVNCESSVDVISLWLLSWLIRIHEIIGCLSVKPWCNWLRRL